MMCIFEVKCPDCNLPSVGRHGKGCKGNQQYLCQNEGCKTKSFMLEIITGRATGASRKTLLK